MATPGKPPTGFFLHLRRTETVAVVLILLLSVLDLALVVFKK